MTKYGFFAQSSKALTVTKSFPSSNITYFFHQVCFREPPNLSIRTSVYTYIHSGHEKQIFIALISATSRHCTMQRFMLFVRTTLSYLKCASQWSFKTMDWQHKIYNSKSETKGNKKSEQNFGMICYWLSFFVQLCLVGLAVVAVEQEITSSIKYCRRLRSCFVLCLSCTAARLLKGMLMALRCQPIRTCCISHYVFSVVQIRPRRLLWNLLTCHATCWYYTCRRCLSARTCTGRNW